MIPTILTIKVENKKTKIFLFRNFLSFLFLTVIIKINYIPIFEVYFVKNRDLNFIKCACKVTEKKKLNQISSKREEVKELIEQLRKVYDKVDMNIYNSTKNVNLNTIISYVQDGKVHHFMDNY